MSEVIGTSSKDKAQQGKYWISSSLNDIEKIIVPFLLEGESNKEIAYRLGMELPTTKYHMRNICDKLGAKNRTHAALIIQKTFYSIGFVFFL